MDIYHSAASYGLSGTCYALSCNLKPLTAWDEHTRFFFFLISKYTWWPPASWAGPFFPGISAQEIIWQMQWVVRSRAWARKGFPKEITQLEGGGSSPPQAPPSPCRPDCIGKQGTTQRQPRTPCDRAASCTASGYSCRIKGCHSAG